MTTSRFGRDKIWERLARVARPDTRFHLNFAEFIPDFDGADIVAARLAEMPDFGADALAFVTPDASLMSFRQRLLEDGHSFIVSSYNMRRGFLLMDSNTIPHGHEKYAAWLDGMEHFGQPVTLEDIARMGRITNMVTGASAVTTGGVRFGKGHGFFDLEWGLFSDLGLVDDTTPVIAVVHDVQVVDEPIVPSQTDIVVDMIATPTQTIRVARQTRRPRGVDWGLMTTERIAATPPLKELARMRGIA